MLAQRTALLWVTCLFLCSLNALGQQTAAMVQNEVRMLEFIGGGSPLNATERRQAASVVAMAMQDAPDRWKSVDQTVSQLLAQIAQRSQAYNNTLREELRYVYAFPKPGKNGWPREFDIEQSIIANHDPVIALDDKHHWLFTRHMVPFLLQTAAWAAKSYELPAPGSEFFATIEQADLKNFGATDPVVAAGLAHIEKNAWFAPAYFNKAPAQLRTAFFARSKATTFHNLDHYAVEQRQIGEAGAVIAAWAAKNSPPPNAGMSDNMLMMKMTSNAMTQAMRSMSPGCNVATTSVGARASNNCNPSSVMVP
jgi:hypothetical protein